MVVEVLSLNYDLLDKIRNWLIILLVKLKMYNFFQDYMADEILVLLKIFDQGFRKKIATIRRPRRFQQVQPLFVIMLYILHINSNLLKF